MCSKMNPKDSSDRHFYICIVLLFVFTFLLGTFSITGDPSLSKYVIATQAFGQEHSNHNEQASESNNITRIVSFNASQGQLPEGVAIINDTLFVSFAPLAQVVRINADLAVDTAAPNQNQSFSAFTEFGSWPSIPQNGGFMIGVAFDGEQNLYAAISSQTPGIQSGVYRTESNGSGNATLFVTHPKMQLPNTLLFDERGQLYISDSAAGTIFLAQPNGTITEWVSHSLLQGNSSFCPNTPDLELDVGANGMAIDANNSNLFVTNSDRASIIRIPIEADSFAGEPQVFVGPDCEDLAGADGIVIDELANDLIVAVNKLDKIVRVSIDNRSISTVASGGILDFPATLAIKSDTEAPGGPSSEFEEADPESNGINKDRTLYVTNFAFLSAQQNLEQPNPAVLSIHLGNAPT
jgi:hypothetical protein